MFREKSTKKHLLNLPFNHSIKSGGRNSSKQAGKQEIFFCYFFKLVGKIGKSIKFLFSFLSSLGKYIRLINLNEKQRESIRERHYDY